MIGALLRKELREHGRLIVGLALAHTAVWLLLLQAERAVNSAISVLSIAETETRLMGWLGGFVLAQALLVHEVRNKTLLFLECLPVTRTRVLAAKVVLGSALVVFFTASMCAATLVLAAQREPVGPQFIGLIIARASAFALFAFSISFLLSALGRYRYPALAACLISVVFLSESDGTAFWDLGPMALLDHTFAVERELWPLRAFLWALVGAAGAFGAVFILFSLREGSVAILLGERMSHRERLFVAGALLLLVFTSFSWAQKKAKAPFQLKEPDTILRRTGALELEVSLAGDPARGATLGDVLAFDLDRVASDLSIPRFAPVFVLHAGELDPGHIKRGALSEREGVLVRANLAVPELDLFGLEAWLIGDLLDARTHKRTRFEPRMWVRDGGAEWLAVRTASTSGQEDPPRVTTEVSRTERLRRLTLRALFAARAGYAPEDVARWLLVRERLGPEVAAAFAWSGIQALCEAQGEARCRAFLRAAIGREVPRDARAVLAERTESIPKLLEREGGLSATEHAGLWRAWLARASERHADALAAIPQYSGEVVVESISEVSRRLDYRVEITPTPEVPLRYAVDYAVLFAFDQPLEPEALSRIDVEYRAGVLEKIPRTFSRGTRVFTTFAFEIPALACEVRVGTSRRALE